MNKPRNRKEHSVGLEVKPRFGCRFPNRKLPKAKPQSDSCLTAAHAETAWEEQDGQASPPH